MQTGSISLVGTSYTMLKTQLQTKKPTIRAKVGELTEGVEGE